MKNSQSYKHLSAISKPSSQIDSIWIRFKDWGCVELCEIDFLSKIFADWFDVAAIVDTSYL